MASVYEIVTEKIIEKMDKGIIPWHQPWHGASTDRWCVWFLSQWRVEAQIHRHEYLDAGGP